MKHAILPVLVAFISLLPASGVDDPTYTNWIYQFQSNGDGTLTMRDSTTVTPTGSQLSALAINPGGARFDLSTIKSLNGVNTPYALDSCYVGTYVPQATVVLDSADPWGKDLTVTGPVPKNLPAMVRRTRADQPFTAYVTVAGLMSGADDPVASKSVKLLRHTQSYGTTGTGVGLDRTQATLLSQASIAANGTQTLSYTLTSIAGADRSKVRGEERFSVFSLADYQAPESQLASQYIQIWPVATAAISGLAQDQLIRYAMPTVTVAYNDLYPGCGIYAQVYKGSQVLGTTGKQVSGGQKNFTEYSVPQNFTSTLLGTDLDKALDSDGRWTLEVLTQTPFGTDRLGYVSFNVDRTIEVNGSFTTIE